MPVEANGKVNLYLDSRKGYYIGIDKYKNLYVNGFTRSNSFYELWGNPKLYGKEAKSESDNEYIELIKKKEADIKLEDIIIDSENSFQKKLSNEEYDKIISLMDEVDSTYLRDLDNPKSAFESVILDAENIYTHYFKYKDKFYAFGTLIFDQELGWRYANWGETVTNNIIRVRGIIDKYIDGSIDL